MLPLHRYSLCLLLLVSVHASSKGKHSHSRGAKEKRDIEDLRDDPLLLSIFKSDIQEKRKDRSISTEQETKDTTPKESTPLKNIDTTTTDSSRVARDVANISLPIPHNIFANFADTPMVGSQVPLADASKLFSYDGKSADESAVVPQLFQANYMPMENLEMANPAFHVPSETVASVEDALQKKSTIPEVPYLINVPAVNPSTMSAMYNNDIFKKDDIPEVTLPGSEGALDEAILKADEAMKGSEATPAAINTPVSTTATASAAPASPVGTTTSGGISPPPAAAPAEQKSTVDAPQVQNLDGTITRPLIKEDDMCADQYATCADFAKAEYCTKYSDLMKIQCRKSCGYCVPGQRDVVEEPAKAKGNSTDAKSTVEPEAPPTDIKSTDAVKTDAKADAKADVKTDAKVDANTEAKAAKAPESAKNDTEGTKKSTTPTIAKPLNGKEQKSKIAESESGSTNEGDANEAESGDFGSGEASGSGSGSGDEAEPTVIKNVVPEKSKKVVVSAAATKATITKAKEDKKKDDKKKETKSKVVKATKKKEEKKEDKRLEVKNKITTVIKQTKSNLGEFTLPVIKSEVSTASLALNDKSESEESGSGSGSGDEEAEEQTLPAKKTAIVEKPKAKTKVPAKKEVKEVKVVKTAKEVKKSEKPKVKETKAKATKKSKKADKPAKKNKVPAKSPVKEPKVVKPAKGKVVAKKSIVPRGPKRTIPYPKIDLRLIASALAHYEEAALELAGEYPKQVDVKEQEVSRSSIPKPEAPAARAAPPAPVAPVAPVTRATPTAAVVAPAAPVAATPSAAPVERIEKESRSFIPHAPPMQTYDALMSAQPYFAPIQEMKKDVIIDPLEKYRQNLQIAKILTDDRNGRSTIPKYLRLTKDVHTTEEEEDKMEKSKADSLTSVQKRFNILGVEPTLIDYYAETGKINPFAKKKKKESNVKKSAINANSDPYEYLRNMPAGASMLPIDDPKARSKVPSDHSYPVFLMKVSPGERKYIEEPPRRRGEIRHLNAEGVEMDETTESNGIPKDIVTEMQKTAATAAKKTQLPPPAQNPFVIPATAPLSMINMMNAANNLRSSLLRAQGSALQAKAGVPQAPKPPAAPAQKTQVPKPGAKPAPAPGELTDAAAKAMERSAMSIGMQYAQSQMKALQQQQKKANARARLPNPRAPRPPAARVQPAQQRNRINPAINFRPQNNLVKPGTGIARATSPLLNPAFAMDPQMNQNMLSESG